MAVAILLGGFGLLVAAIVVAVKTAARARREREDLDDAFAEARDHAQDYEAKPAPWSSFDLAVLRDDVAAIDQRDPFATLTRVSAPISWHAPNGNGSEPKRIVWRAQVDATAS